MDVVGDVYALDADVGEAAVRVGDECDLADERHERLRVRAGALRADVSLQRQPRRGPIEEPGVAEAVAELERRRRADTRLAG